MVLVHLERTEQPLAQSWSGVRPLPTNLHRSCERDAALAGTVFGRPPGPNRRPGARYLPTVLAGLVVALCPRNRRLADRLRAVASVWRVARPWRMVGAAATAYVSRSLDVAQLRIRRDRWNSRRPGAA